MNGCMRRVVRLGSTYGLSTRYFRWLGRLRPMGMSGEEAAAKDPEGLMMGLDACASLMQDPRGAAEAGLRPGSVAWAEVGAGWVDDEVHVEEQES